MKSDVSTKPPPGRSAAFQALPPVDRVVASPQLAEGVSGYGRDWVVQVTRDVIAEAREAIRRGAAAPALEEICRTVAERVAHPSNSVMPVINATGVLVHTNLGRAPLSDEAQAAMRAASGYATVEFDLDAGGRGDRHRHGQKDLIALTGAEDACVVNNCAAAVVLVLSAVAQGGDVIVSRGELVEIGGGFRVPDVMRTSGVTLCEVGTTNRTHASDYAAALGDRTRALMKVHRSNFSIDGFTAEVSVRELSDIAKAHDTPLLVDAGAGLLRASDLVPGEPPVARYIEHGADLVCFSGDKLLGGPQAGLIVGRADLVEQCRRHPLMRAFRCDKVTLAALGATLHAWRYRPDQLPLLRLLAEPDEALRNRAHRIVAAVDDARLSVVDSTARIGGGSAPSTTASSVAVCVTGAAAEVQHRLRDARLPVIGRIHQEALRLELRTVWPAEDDQVVEALRLALANPSLGETELDDPGSER